uniref:Ptu1-like peptide pp9a n=1 Tax=Pristhesancus plagipennis TaxID=1955184 RepID=A0A1Q1NP74_PRIPG|nr:ptu1-like peptide pp9a [Pristhesancus plagipennis]
MKWIFLIFIVIYLIYNVSARVFESRQCIPRLEKCVGQGAQCCPPSHCLWYANKCI